MVHSMLDAHMMLQPTAIDIAVLFNEPDISLHSLASCPIFEPASTTPYPENSTIQEHHPQDLAHDPGDPRFEHLVRGDCSADPQFGHHVR